MQILEIEHNDHSFKASVCGHEGANKHILFAVGGGGDPQRHEPLLKDLADAGFFVVAPHFERMLSPFVDDQTFISRSRRLKYSRVLFPGKGSNNIKLFGVGHSIGATTLLAMSGLQTRTKPGPAIPIETFAFERLALFAPPLDFFRTDGAPLDLACPTAIWMGEQDKITPASNMKWFSASLASPDLLKSHIVEQAGHFTFMDHAPPGQPESHPDRNAFLTELRQNLIDFITDG